MFRSRAESMIVSTQGFRARSKRMQPAFLPKLAHSTSEPSPDEPGAVFSAGGP